MPREEYERRLTYWRAREVDATERLREAATRKDQRGAARQHSRLLTARAVLSALFDMLSEVHA